MGAKDQLTKLEKTVQRLREERQNKREIFDAIHDGIIVFKPSLSIQNINTPAKTLLQIDDKFHPEKHSSALYKNKKATITFKLDNWLNIVKATPSPDPTEMIVWYCHPATLQTTPLLLSAKAMLNKKGRLKNVLLVIYDRTVHTQADEQKRLMLAAFESYNAQFISNEKGYIIKPNDSFIAISGLTKSELKKMTLMEWIERQVFLKNDTEGLLKTLLEHRFWSSEVELHPTKETTFHAILSISMVADKEYNIEHYIVNIQNITDLKEAHRKIEHMAFYDGLTGLANRKLAIEYINSTIKNHRRHKSFSALLYINLDRFKSINDAFGRRTGDRFLIKIAKVLRGILREEDNIARVGGDEFVVVTQDREADSEQATRNALKLANKISNALNHHFLVDELTLHSSVRIGVIIYPGENNDSAENLLVKADLAVTKAKNIKKKYKVFIYDPVLSEEVKSCRQLESDLIHAYERGEIELHFQAQMGDGHELHGAETLARWKHPILGFVSPERFIRIAEESRQILKLGAWIMHQAFIQAKSWTVSKPNFNLAINISPIQFHDADFIENVIYIMIETKVNPQNITLELTEGILISDTESAVEKIARLAELGFKISIDDFGTGYSSLSYFQRLPIHELKIDKSFIARVPNSKEDVAIIESIVHLAKTKELLIVAEGVETQEQFDFIQEQTTNIIVQGYFFGKPCPAREFEASFLQNKSNI